MPYNNTDWDFSFQLKYTDGQDVDLSGKNLVMNLTSVSDPAIIHVLTSEDNHLDLTEGAQGKIRVVPNYSVVSMFTEGEYKFQVIEIVSEYSRKNLLQGKLRVRNG